MEGVKDKGEIIATGLFGETMRAERSVPGRWIVLLTNERGSVVSTADFADAEEAAAYRADAEQSAKVLGGRVIVITPEGETRR